MRSMLAGGVGGGGARKLEEDARARRRDYEVDL